MGVRHFDKNYADTLYAPIATSPKVFQAVVDPTVTDDTTPLGAKIGDIWVNTATGNVFDCISAANGAAVWRHRQRVWQGGTKVDLTGSTSETTLATVTLPASVIGAHGQLEIRTHRQFTNNANGKTSRFRLGGIGGTAFRTTADAGTAGISDSYVIANAGAENAQIGGQASTGNGLGVGALTAGAIDTAALTTLVITGQLTNGADTFSLMAYRVTLTRPDIGP